MGRIAFLGHPGALLVEPLKHMRRADFSATCPSSHFGGAALAFPAHGSLEVGPSSATSVASGNTVIPRNSHRLKGSHSILGLSSVSRPDCKRPQGSRVRDSAHGARSGGSSAPDRRAGS